jgi:hypothetical protein
MMRSLLGKGVAALLVTGMLFSVSGAELLPNPGFDDLGGGSLGEGWGKFGAADFNDFFGGNPHASFFSDNVGNWGGVFYQGIAGAAGVTYQFDLLDVRLEANIDADYYFGLEFFLGDDATQISKVEQPIPLAVTGDGLSFSMNATAPAGTAFVRPIIRYENTRSTAAGQENAFVFTTSLTPEPSSLMLLGLASLGLLRRR